MRQKLEHDALRRKEIQRQIFDAKEMRRREKVLCIHVSRVSRYTRFSLHLKEAAAQLERERYQEEWEVQQLRTKVPAHTSGVVLAAFYTLFDGPA